MAVWHKNEGKNTDGVLLVGEECEKCRQRKAKKGIKQEYLEKLENACKEAVKQGNNSFGWKKNLKINI